MVFLSGRQQRVFSSNYCCSWKVVNKGTTHGSVSGPHLFNIFLNDLEIVHNGARALLKYADDSTILVPVLNNIDTSATLVSEFLNWSKDNGMPCNPRKCKELIFTKKSNNDVFEPINCIPQYDNLCLLGVTFQSNCKFSSHIKLKVSTCTKNFTKGAIQSGRDRPSF